MAECIEYPHLSLLPEELLFKILTNNNCREILNFGATCKLFHTFVSSNQYLWKEKVKVTLPKQIYDVIDKYGQGEWLRELKRYLAVKQVVFTELLSMSPTHYWRRTEITMQDLKTFFSLALANNTNHYYVVFILRDIVRKANEYVNKNCSERPYTLTEIYYSKCVLRYLVHTYLAVKWYQNHLGSALSPQYVVNFFLQWSDTATVYSDGEVEDTIRNLVDDVEKVLLNDETEPIYSLRDKIAEGKLNQMRVLQAISEVIYHQQHIAIMPSANLETLNIVQVVKNKSGHSIAVAAIYQAVASRCGVKCELIAFPNHLFLEWRDQDQAFYKIDLEFGTIMPKRRCPYSSGPERDDLRYCPDTFLQYIIGSFLMTMGAHRTWTTQNAIFLQDFMSTCPVDDNPYKHYQEYLVDCDLLPAMSISLQPEFLHESAIKIIEHLVKITYNPTPVNRITFIKTRNRRLRFAVGMLCYHRKYDYLCVIRGWDASCSVPMRLRLEFKKLREGSDQPFYNVIAVDQSERYVPQEHLIDVSRPNRLYHLEDLISKDFTHFDGYSYVPNPEKVNEYPEDEPIRATYKARFELRDQQRAQAVNLQ